MMKTTTTMIIDLISELLSEIFCGTRSRDDQEELTMEAPEIDWDLHYYEASIYLQEGVNNDKFTINPRDPARRFAYKVVHSTWFHLLNLFASLCLLALTIIEPPSYNFIHIPFWVRGIVEVSMLLVIGVELVMKLNWLGLKHVLRHTRTMLKLILFVIMLVESMVLMIRQASHFRVTRALRPLFLLDSFYCRNIRRFIRQLLQSLRAIFDVLFLLVSFMLIFSILGFFLFSNNSADTYFQSISDSFISLFILMTTANFPDVMLPSFKKSKWSAIFFIVYISIELFIFMNMFLAVVYSAFVRAEKEKFKKLFLHKRKGCKLAYQLLASDETPDGISFKHFRGCMNYYTPSMSFKDIYLLFKSLDISDSGSLTVNEFANMFDNIKLKWKKEESTILEHISYPRKLQSYLSKFVSTNWFNNIIYVVILLNFVWVMCDSVRLSVLKNQSQNEFDWTFEEDKFYWITVIFALVYAVEVLLKLLGLGFPNYFSSGWNIFDFCITVALLSGILLQLATNNMHCIMIVRPLRVLRLFKLKSGLRHVFSSLFMLVSRIFSLAVVMMLLMYFFAIIGIEVFSPYTENLKNCCINTSVQQYYAYINGSGVDGYYYLCTFETLLDSGITLFELTVVNNWWIIMEGYAHVVSPWSRIYFMLYYLVTMLVLAVVVAFILESYLFREQCRQEFDGHRYQVVLVSLTPQELTELECGGAPTPAVWKELEPSPNVTFYEGTRKLEKDDFTLKMYSSEIQGWIECSDRHST